LYRKGLFLPGLLDSQGDNPYNPGGCIQPQRLTQLQPQGVVSGPNNLSVVQPSPGCQALHLPSTIVPKILDLYLRKVVPGGLVILSHKRHSSFGGTRKSSEINGNSYHKWEKTRNLVKDHRNMVKVYLRYKVCSRKVSNYWPE